MDEYENRKSEIYHHGKIDGVKSTLSFKCKECESGYEPELKDKKWMHKDVECGAQREWSLIKKFEDDKHEAYLNKRYGRMWHTSYKNKNWMLDKKCYCCNEKATKRIDVNCWGVVAEYDVCEKHAERYDGKNCDEVMKEKEKLVNRG